MRQRVGGDPYFVIRVVRNSSTTWPPTYTNGHLHQIHFAKIVFMWRWYR